MRTIACRAATVALSLRIFQTPGFIVRNHILRDHPRTSIFLKPSRREARTK
jgi:hypothetical protein